MGIEVLETVYHMLFADEKMTFCKAEDEQLRFLRGILACFEVVWVLKINMHKSILIVCEASIVLGLDFGVSVPIFNRRIIGGCCCYWRCDIRPRIGGVIQGQGDMGSSDGKV